MARLAGQFPQSRIKQRRKTFFRQNWWRILLVGAFLGAILIGVAPVVPHSSARLGCMALDGHHCGDQSPSASTREGVLGRSRTRSPQVAS
jgi:hypothetical protein